MLARLGEQVQYNLAVHRCLEDRAFGLKFLAEFGGIHQISIMCDGNLPAGGIDDEGLGVAACAGPGG